MSDVAKSTPTIKDWCNASRPQYYIATVIPIALGFVLAGESTGIWRYGIFLLVLFASFLIHLATNLANDVFDKDSGVDGSGSIGGSIAQREGRLTRKHYIIALLLLYGLYIALAPFIILPSSQPILWLFAAFGLFSSIYYTAPPFRFGYRAMGEILVFLNMGITMTLGSFMACSHEFKLYILAFGVIIGLMVAAILYFQSLPEIDTDGEAGKRTLAVRLGMKNAFVVYHLWWPVIWLLITMLWFTGNVSILALGWIFAIPFYIKATAIMRLMQRKDLLELDSKGYLTRLMYLITGIFLIIGVISWK